LGFDATSIEDYGKVPNPIRFILVLADLARIVDAYSKIVSFHFEKRLNALGLVSIRDNPTCTDFQV
jgi:hypothetical protein